MQIADIKDVIEREPFRAFTVRLSNGTQYHFASRKHLGASQNYGMIFYFADAGGACRIDRENIIEIIEAE